MTKNIQITTLGGYINDKLPYLYLHGIKNAVRDITGLDYSLEVKEKSGTINYKKEKKEIVKFSFTIPYDEFRASKISYDIELSFLIYNTYPDFKDNEVITAQHFNGYITKLKKNNLNAYDIEITRTTKIYNVELMNKYWLDINKYGNRQNSFEQIEKELMKPIKLEYNDNMNYPFIKESKQYLDKKYLFRFKPMKEELFYITVENTSNKQNNLISITNQELSKKITTDKTLESYYLELLGKDIKKTISYWNTVVFYNKQHIKGLHIEDNKLVENIKANIIKSIEVKKGNNTNSSYMDNKYFDLGIYNTKKANCYCLIFKEKEIC